MIDIRIHEDVLGLFPATKVFGLQVKGAAGAALAGLAALRLDASIAHLRQAVPTNEALVALPVIAQWREAYKAMGVKASAYRCSVEALARRAIAGKPLHTGVAAVDLYNAASLRHMACLGAYDMRRLADAPLELRFCRPETDRFSPLGGKAQDMPLRPGLVVYAQQDEVLCWALNHRDSEKTGLRPDSTDIVFMAEAVTPEQAECARQALDALRGDARQLGLDASDVQEAANP
ncbi:phenylalanine--tRNA ligase beta subunit-related protein [Ramlibacter sp.]|uniref:B3/B4 domain-containing protein n=1 Tax=Ramlibacter sp. TaxID=1917967 RepID=UPI00179346C3|nr:phenylalanine--tRNA ligase beta subunit-related protein [Ramlibacter sp.]MBA2674976.1 hypothetical protein [Ramlibacter sp.]